MAELAASLALTDLPLFATGASLVGDESPDPPDDGDAAAPSNVTPLERRPQTGTQRPEPVAPYDFPRHFLALAHVRGVGVHALRALLDRFASLDAVWHADPAMVSETLRLAKIPGHEGLAQTIHERRDQLLTEGQRQQEQLLERGITVVGAHEPPFPRRLRELPPAEQPYWLFVEGSHAVLSGPPAVAVVGTREASSEGRQAAGRIAALVVFEGLTLVSGLAEGIDAAAHRSAARVGARQVAVLGTGINVVFPENTRDLRERLVADGGAVVTEYLPNESYERSRFVQRNRIQAGLASAVCAVESREKSGTMHTIRFATRYARPVFGVRYRQLAPANELVDLLAKDGKQIWALDVPGEVERLRAYLHSLAGPRWETPKRPAPPALFRDVIRAYEEVLAYFDATPDELDWLVTRLRSGRSAEDSRE